MMVYCELVCARDALAVKQVEGRHSRIVVKAALRPTAMWR